MTGIFIEEVVRDFVKHWIGHRQLVHGTFYSTAFEKSGEGPLQIDGIVYDPKLGPTILRQGDFAVVHPVFCTSVIEIKTTYAPGVIEFENRLRKIYHKYMYHVTTPQVMGIIVADSDPEKHSVIDIGRGNSLMAYNYSTVPWCPVFILYKEVDNEYTPFEPAIDAMIRAVYTNQYDAGNYL